MTTTTIRPTRPKTYRFRDALALVERHGFTYHSIRQDDARENFTVSIVQDWTPRGREMVRFRRARGKWRGNDCGGSYRDENPYARG